MDLAAEMVAAHAADAPSSGAATVAPGASERTPEEKSPCSWEMSASAHSSQEEASDSESLDSTNTSSSHVGTSGIRLPASMPAPALTMPASALRQVVNAAGGSVVNLNIHIHVRKVHVKKNSNVGKDCQKGQAMAPAAQRNPLINVTVHNHHCQQSGGLTTTSASSHPPNASTAAASERLTGESSYALQRKGAAFFDDCEDGD